MCSSERREQVTLTQTASHGMTGQQVYIPDSISARALSDSRSAGDPLKYLATVEYNCLFPWSMSLETQWLHVTQVPIAEFTIGT